MDNTLIADETTQKQATANADINTIIPQLNTPLQYSFNKILKRFADIVISILAFVFILSWLIPLLALFIKLTSGGTIFFGQARTGLDNENFTCWKLRTMKRNDNAHTHQAILNDNRITFAGKFLRKYSLDELPQFYNVLKGDMSVIGPRPHMLKHTEEFSKAIEDYALRHIVKPGITGLSQVKGYRGEIQDKHALRNRITFDIFYLKKWSIGLDLWIVFKTIKLLLLGDKNAY